jgi:serine/threonine protein kinase
MTGNIGTPLYMAPELKNSSRTPYTKKVDIYALGIILFEIICKMTTEHERTRLLGQLKNDRVAPARVSDSLRFAMALVYKMTN